MKKILLGILLLIPSLALAVPSNTMSIVPVAVTGTTITASDENARNNTVTTAYNAHSHTDISQTGNTLSVGDAAAGNKTITANNGDASKPFIRYDDTGNDWEFSIDGSITALQMSGSDLVFEGSTDNLFETIIRITDPTAARLITVPNASGTVVLNTTQVVLTVTNSANQSINNGTLTKVTFDTESIDSHNYFSANRFTPQTAGNYYLNISATIDQLDNTETFDVYIYKNGGSIGQAFAVSPVDNAVISAQSARAIAMNGTTDYLEIYVQHSHASALNLNGTPNLFFSAFRISDQ